MWTVERGYWLGLRINGFFKLPQIAMLWGQDRSCSSGGIEGKEAQRQRVGWR